jgi:adenine/guanine phosphoribosyltransferase-like PRPP-binding protein
MASTTAKCMFGINSLNAVAVPTLATISSITKTTSSVLVIDDIVDKGGTAKALREFMPNMHLAVVYAKPRGLPLANTYVEEITQETWPVFPWDEEDKANH